MIFIDTCLIVFKFLLIISLIFIIIGNISHIKIQSPFNQSIDKNAEFIKVIIRPEFYLPLLIIAVSFITIQFLNNYRNTELTKLIKQKLIENNVETIPRTTHKINLENFKSTTETNRIYVDSIYTIDFDYSNKITFKRKSSDSTSFWVYLDNEDEPIATYKINK